MLKKIRGLKQKQAFICSTLKVKEKICKPLIKFISSKSVKEFSISLPNLVSFYSRYISAGVYGSFWLFEADLRIFKSFDCIKIISPY